MYKELKYLDDEQAGIRLSTDSTKRTLTIEMYWNYIETDIITITEEELSNDLGLSFGKNKLFKTVKVSEVAPVSEKPVKKVKSQPHLLRHAGMAKKEVKEGKK
jgi:hypothetical protein